MFVIRRPSKTWGLRQGPSWWGLRKALLEEQKEERVFPEPEDQVCPAEAAALSIPAWPELEP